MTGRPLKSALPLEIGVRPASARRRVVLPQPEGPTTQTNSCSATMRSTSRRTGCAPKETLSPRASSTENGDCHHLLEDDLLRGRGALRDAEVLEQRDPELHVLLLHVDGEGRQLDRRRRFRRQLEIRGLRLPRLGFIRLDVGERVADRFAELARGLGVLLDEVAPHDVEGLEERVGDRRHGYDVAHLGLLDAGDERLDRHDDIHLAALQQVAHRREAGLDVGRRFRIDAVVLQPLHRHDVVAAVQAGHADALAADVGGRLDVRALARHHADRRIALRLVGRGGDDLRVDAALDGEQERGRRQRARLHCAARHRAGDGRALRHSLQRHVEAALGEEALVLGDESGHEGVCRRVAEHDLGLRGRARRDGEQREREKSANHRFPPSGAMIDETLAGQPVHLLQGVVRMEALDYRRLFETAPVLTLVLDRDLRVVAASDAFLAATMTRREAIVGQDLLRVFPTEPERPGFRGEKLAHELLARVLREGTPQRLTLQRYDVPRPATAGGGFERRYWTALFAPFAGSEGVAHIVCTVEDVTDRGRDAGLATAVSVDAIGIVFFDRRGTLISANDTFLRWTGFTRQDLATETVTWRTLTPPEYVAASEEQLARFDATGRTGPYEKEYFTKDGRRVWMLFVGARLEDGSLVEYVIDISDRKAAERERREVEERYRTLFDSLDAGFCVIEMVYDTHGRPSDYRFIEVNQAFERQTGLRDATANSMREHAPEHEQHWFDIYARIAETGESARFIEEARALGFWYEVFAFRVGAEAGRRVGILFYDITERVRAQRALQEEARRKDEFLATLAHELRNPLAPIRNAVALLHYRHGANEDLQSAANLIDRQVTQLARLVDDLLDVSRIRFGKVQLQRAPIDLREVAKDAVATSEPVLVAARHRLHLDLGTEPVWVDADRVRLAQVIANLLNNAARYTPPGGRIRLEVSHGENEASIAVQDNGIGIEPALLERVFEPFAQLETREALASGGIGIGLSLAKALIELHGGHIGAQSAGAGKGSRFVACLPRVAAPKPAAASANGAQKPSRRLLVVDDNVDAAASQAALLRVLGHEVEVAYDGETALEKARAFRPDIVLLDLGMPGMDGYEVARRLRASDAGRELKLVAQTGWAQEEDRRRTREAGFDAHLAKPVDVTLLQLVL